MTTLNIKLEGKKNILKFEVRHSFRPGQLFEARPTLFFEGGGQL